MAFGTIIKSFTAPGTTVAGISYVDGYLFICDYTTDLIYQLSLNGAVVRSFSSPSTSTISGGIHVFSWPHAPHLITSGSFCMRIW